ncbi:Uncharacterized protein APZ42_029792 [Daphnia magna]|uniref:Uncharacterized protein n=1 Tax=Daphnia magna TaxID=35525 RepID=A0A164PBQ2_9CRUS|nr:Uncharacterized protein APZ42_029792 [Daphnia magna]
MINIVGIFDSNTSALALFVRAQSGRCSTTTIRKNKIKLRARKPPKNITDGRERERKRERERRIRKKTWRM